MPRIKQNTGQGLVEYILIVTLMGFLAIVGIKSLSTKTNTAFNTTGEALLRQVNSATSGS